MSTQEKVIEIAKKVLEENIDLETSIYTSQNWDSLNHLKILVEIEKEFSCQLPIEKIGNVDSVGGWIALVESIKAIDTLKEGSNL